MRIGKVVVRSHVHRRGSLQSCKFPGSRMTSRIKILCWHGWAGLLLVLIAALAFGQNRRDQQRNTPRPNVQQRQEPRQQTRENRRESRPQFNREPTRPQNNRELGRPQFQAPQPPKREDRPYRPPTEGNYSGQWLNQHRAQPLDQQKRALENDPAFRRLPRETQRDYEQRLQHFNSLPSERQQQVLRRMATWEHLTPEQKQNLRGIGSQFNSLPPDRRRAVRNAIDTLRAMPPDARQRELQSGRFNQFSPQERDILNGAARLPLAPAPEQPNGSPPQPPSNQQNTGQQRYIPRPPR